ncbi:riboflavin kinase [bacterium]|nr:riboflavin kinase [bacterium]
MRQCVHMIFKGIIQHGNGTGKTLGFPTLNIPLEDETVSGIYAAIVTIKGSPYHAAAYADTRRKLLEAHLLHFEDDLYGLEATIELKKKIREDQRFEDEAELKKAIAADIDAIMAYFA